MWEGVGHQQRLLALRGATLLVVALIASAMPVVAQPGHAAPGELAASVVAHQQTPEWLSADDAAQLDLGFEVLVPMRVPEPFSGEPQIIVTGESYRLYWAVFGGPPTFLEISGTLDGEIPDYSEYDRNNQLEQNASVQGDDAYHEITPNYDQVYWQSGNVVYKVSSRNMTGSDSLTLANTLEILATPSGDDEPAGDAALVPDVPPGVEVPETVHSGEVVSIVVQGVVNMTLTATGGVFVETSETSHLRVGGSPVEWRAPETAVATWVEFRLIDPRTGEWLFVAATQVMPGPPPEEAPAEPTSVPTAAPTPASDSGTGSVTDQADSQQGQPSDESDGDDPGLNSLESELSSSDGTGGSDVLDVVTPASDAPSGVESNGETEVAATEAAALDETEGGSGPATPSPVASPVDLAPTVVPTATLAPSTGADGLVAVVIGPDGGELVNPKGAGLTLPAGALSEPSTVRIRPVSDARLPVSPDVDFVPGTGFDITVATLSGEAVTNLGAAATLRMTLEPEQRRDGVVIYWIHDGQLEALAGSELDDSGVTAQLDHFSRFAVGTPVLREPAQRSWMPWILAGLGTLTILGVGGAGLAMRRRRDRAAISWEQWYR